MDYIDSPKPLYTLNEMVNAAEEAVGTLKKFQNMLIRCGREVDPRYQKTIADIEGYAGLFRANPKTHFKQNA